MIIAIDPGRSGGIAWSEVGVGIRAVSMPREEHEIADLVRRIVTSASDPVFAYMELVGGYIKPQSKSVACPDCRGRGSYTIGDAITAETIQCERCDGTGNVTDDRENRQPGHMMHKFGRNVGVVVGVLLAFGIKPKEIHPATWQKIFFLNLRGKPQPERKRILKDAAQRLFPQLKVTLNTCDALLLYRFGEQTESQNLFRLSDGSGNVTIESIPIGERLKQAIKAAKK